MPKMCPHCPFRSDGDYLRPDRWEGIKNAVLIGQPFHCHETVHSPRTRWIELEDGGDEPARGAHWQECRGALDYRRDTLTADPEAAARALQALLSDLESSA